MDWDKVFAKFEAAVDWPAATYYQELAEHFPDAKVILSVARWSSGCCTVLASRQMP